MNRVSALVAVAAVSLASLTVEAGTSSAPAAFTGAHPPSYIVITPTADASTGRIITWRSSSAYATEKVAYHAAGGPTKYVTARRKPATTVRNSGSAAPAYTATITGLQPDTKYYYTIITTGGTAGEYWFRTSAAELTKPWRFLAFGDTQIDNANVPLRIIAAARKRFPADLFLQAGDTVNRPYRHVEWRDLFSALGLSRYTRTWAISIGNHEQCILVSDCRSNDGEGFRTYFTWPDNAYPEQRDTWFYTDYPGLRLIVLDDFADDLARQAAFLDDALTENPQKWSVVLMHAGPFSSRADRSQPGVRKYLLPVIRKHDVDLVLNGHDHSYARGYAGDPDSTVFATSVSGPKYYGTGSIDWYRNGATKVRTARQISTYQVVDVGPDTLTYRAVVVSKGPHPAPSIGYTQALDTVTITKSGGTKTVDW